MGGNGAALDREEEREEGGDERTDHVGPSFLLGGELRRIWDTGGMGVVVVRGGKVLVYESAVAGGGEVR